MRFIVFLACLSLALALPRPAVQRPRSDLDIVGGEMIPTHSRPYQVAVLLVPYLEYLHCGGALIHRDWVLTAAHCYMGKNVGKWVGLGAFNLSETDAQIIKGDWIVHEGYPDDGTFLNDIALIHLESSAILSEEVKLVGLPSAGDDLAVGTDLLVSGWGKLSTNGRYPLEMRQVVLQSISNADCVQRFPAGNITDSMICAIADEKGACKGDSGGPVVSGFEEDQFTGNEVLQGVVSWGYDCADPYYPSVFTSVSMYCDWLADKTKDEVTC